MTKSLRDEMRRDPLRSEVKSVSRFGVAENILISLGNVMTRKATSLNIRDLDDERICGHIQSVIDADV